MGYFIESRACISLEIAAKSLRSARATQQPRTPKAQAIQMMFDPFERRSKLSRIDHCFHPFDLQHNAAVAIIARLQAFGPFTKLPKLGLHLAANQVPIDIIFPIGEFAIRERVSSAAASRLDLGPQKINRPA